MFKNFRDKVALSGISVLAIGVALLIFTFLNAYGFLNRILNITGGDFTQIFGSALGPLIETCIHVMYLGVMGWIGSLLTVRGVTLIVNAPKAGSETSQDATTAQQQQSVQKAKEGSKSKEKSEANSSRQEQGQPQKDSPSQ